MNGSSLGQCSWEGGVYSCLIKGLQGTMSGSAWKDKQVECVFACGAVVDVCVCVCVCVRVCGLLPCGIF